MATSSTSSRTLSRRSRPAASSVPSGPPAQVPALPAGWWDVWRSAAAPWQDMADAWWQVGRQTLDAVGRDAAVEAAEVRDGRAPQDVVGLQMAFGAEETLRLVQMAGQAWAATLEMQGRWWREAEAFAARLLQPWQGLTRHAVAHSAGTLIVPPEVLQPGALFDAALEAWPVAADVCLNALQHDLQETPPPSAAP